MVVLALVVAGCGSSTATPTASIADGPAATAAPTATPATPTIAASATPVPTPSATPAPSSAVRTLPGFDTPAPTASDLAWASVHFAPIAADDPVASIVSMARWDGGFVALGPELTNHDGTARTPAWTSTDGATWSPLDPGVFGESTAVLAVSPLGSGVLAITATADTTNCGVDIDNCYDAAPPLQAWTSTDGMTWTAHPVPALLAERADVAPIAAIGEGGVVVVSYDQADGSAAATASRDGETWSDLVPSAFGKGAQVNAVGPIGTGFVAIGDSGGETPVAKAWTSPDGSAWRARPLPFPGAPKGLGTSAEVLHGARDGVLAEGEVQATPGSGVWWTTADGTAWTDAHDYAPLGTWHGPGEGTGLIANGTIGADGERILAMRRNGGTAAWLSADGSQWQDLPVSGLPATSKDDWPVFGMRVMPVGVVVDDGDGHVFLGVPKG